MIAIDVHLAQGGFSLAAAFEGGAGVTALFGPSGSGKSTLVHLIAGLKRPDRGRIVVDGETLVDTAHRIHLPPRRRRIGLVFQDGQLFPHLTVRQNLLYGRLFQRDAGRRIEAAAVIDTLGIAGLLDRRPASLSGGEKQRVAIGRALLAVPRLLLMDEPLAALDQARRQEVMGLIERVRDGFGVPIVYVSHSVDEVARLAERVVVLDGGRVVAVGPPNAVMHGGAPADRFALISVIEGMLGPVDEPYGMTPVHHPAGTVWLAGPSGPVGRRVRVVLRGTEVSLATRRPEGLSIRTILEGRIAAITAAGASHATVEVALAGGETVAAAVTRQAIDALGLAVGRPVFALVKAAALDERTIALPSIRD